jgi:hypothetical protein
MPDKANNKCQGQASRRTPGPRDTEAGAGTTTTEGEAGDRVDREVSLLVAAGSAMAAGCEPCLDQLIPGLIDAGVGDRDIRRALEIGQGVKDAAADYMKEVANVLAGTRLEGGPGPGRCSEAPIKESVGCCG